MTKPRDGLTDEQIDAKSPEDELEAAELDVLAALDWWIYVREQRGTEPSFAEDVKELWDRREL